MSRRFTVPNGRFIRLWAVECSRAEEGCSWPKAQTAKDHDELILDRFKRAAEPKLKKETPKQPEHKPGEVVEVEIAKGVKMKFCWIPAGRRSGQSKGGAGGSR